MASQTQTATRQQLDELDALLQKMLGTPASIPEPANAKEVKPNVSRPSTAPIAQTPPPRPPQFPVPEVAFGIPPAAAFAASSQATAEKAADQRPAWAIDLNPREGSSVIANANLSGQATRPVLAVTTIPLSPPEMSIPLDRPQSAVSRSEVPLLLRPLHWLSDRCDNALNSFGPLGRMFTSHSGRTLMGYVGLAMLLASVASGALAWVGWSW